MQIIASFNFIGLAGLSVSSTKSLYFKLYTSPIFVEGFSATRLYVNALELKTNSAPSVCFGPGQCQTAYVFPRCK